MKVIEVFIPNESSIEEFTARLGASSDEVEVIECPICFLSPNAEWDCHKRVRIVIQEGGEPIRCPTCDGDGCPDCTE